MRCMAALAFLLLGSLAYGQSGSITGTVKDPSGATVPECRHRRQEYRNRRGV
jgi:hypothetical protein